MKIVIAFLLGALPLVSSAGGVFTPLGNVSRIEEYDAGEGIRS